MQKPNCFRLIESKQNPVEAAVRRRSSKQVILTILQYSKENTYVTVSFNKVVLRQKKSILVSRNRPGEKFLSLTRPYGRICIRIYNFQFQKTNIQGKQKKKKTKKKLKKKIKYIRKID